MEALDSRSTGLTASQMSFALKNYHSILVLLVFIILVKMDKEMMLELLGHILLFAKRDHY